MALLALGACLAYHWQAQGIKIFLGTGAVIALITFLEYQYRPARYGWNVLEFEARKRFWKVNQGSVFTWETGRGLLLFQIVSGWFVLYGGDPGQWELRLITVVYLIFTLQWTIGLLWFLPSDFAHKLLFARTDSGECYDFRSNALNRINIETFEIDADNPELRIETEERPNSEMFRNIFLMLLIAFTVYLIFTRSIQGWWFLPMLLPWEVIDHWFLGQNDLERVDCLRATPTELIFESDDAERRHAINELCYITSNTLEHPDHHTIWMKFQFTSTREKFELKHGDAKLFYEWIARFTDQIEPSKDECSPRDYFRKYD